MDGAEDDAALVRRFLDHGDPTAFRCLVERHRRGVFLLALSVLGPGRRAQAEEVAQDTLLHAYRRLGQLRREAAFSAWIRRIAFRSAIDRLRAEQRRRTATEQLAGQPATEPHGPQRRAIRRQTAQTVRRAMRTLPPLYRACLHLVYWLGCSVAESAALLGLPEGTVKSYLYRARQRLRGALEDRIDAP